MAAKRRRKPKNPAWVTYQRAYLVTVGLIVMVALILAWFKEGHAFASWSLKNHLLFFGLFAFGATCIGIGLFSDSKKIERYADAASTHEGAIIIMIIAFPVYLIMSLIRSEDDAR